MAKRGELNRKSERIPRSLSKQKLRSSLCGAVGSFNKDKKVKSQFEKINSQFKLNDTNYSFHLPEIFLIFIVSIN